ncbi:MAG: acyltransferase [Prevotella sp.]|nr:acyltransferase [Prevotella sp.]
MITLKQSRTLPFQGLRVLLMFGIVAFHVYPTPVFGGGSELTCFFFIISGFLYREKYTYKEYMLKKIKGIYPVFWIILGMSILISVIREQYVFKLNIIPHLLLLQSWIPVKETSFTIDYVGGAWFLSSLLFCYAASPPIYRFVCKRNKYELLLLLAFIFSFILFIQHFGKAWCYGNWLTYFSPMERTLEYSIGIVTFAIVRNNRYKESSFKCEIASILIIVLYILLIKQRMFLGGVIIIVHALILAYIYNSNSKVMKLLFANNFVLTISSYIMYVYISHQSITVNCLRSRISSNELIILLCFIFGIAFGIIYNKGMRKIKNVF